jgi:hypothetical protein
MDQHNNQLCDISALGGLTNLNYLRLYNNEICDISPISGLTNLAYLRLDSNPLNADAYCNYLPLIEANNPDIELIYDANPYPPEACGVANYTCSGFDPPMDNGPVTVKKNRALPLKAELLDENGTPMTDADIVALPVLQVIYNPTAGGDPIDATDAALPAGEGTEGNQCEFADGKWRFNLKTKNYTAEGTYTITMLSGDNNEYSIDPTCEAIFIIE